MLGTTGWIGVPPRFHYPSRIVLHRTGHDPQTIDAPLTGAGYAPELAEVTGRVAGAHPPSCRGHRAWSRPPVTTAGSRESRLRGTRPGRSRAHQLPRWPIPLTARDPGAGCPASLRRSASWAGTGSSRAIVAIRRAFFPDK